MLTREQLIANIEAMESQGAKPNEIQEYLDSLKPKSSVSANLSTKTEEKKPSLLGSALNKIGDVVASRSEKVSEISDLYAGKQQGLASSALQTAGQAAGALGDIGFEAVKAITPQSIENAASNLAGKVLGSKPAQAIVAAGQKIAESHPTAARNVGATVNLLSVLPATKALSVTEGIGKGVVGKTLSTGEKIAQKTVKAVKTTISKKDMVREGKKIEEYTQLLGGTKSAIQKFEVKRGKDIKDMAKFAAEENVIPEVTDDLKLKWEKARSGQFDALANDEQILQSELERTPRTVSVSWGKIVGDTNEKIDSMFKNALERQEAKAAALELIDAEKNALGVQPSMSALNESKRGMWQVAYVHGDAKQALRSKVARQVGHAMNEEIARKTNNPLIQAINERMSKRLNLIDLMDATEGNAVKGGRLGKYVGTVVGTTVGSAIPYVGPIGGAYLGTEAAKYIAKRAPVRIAKKAAKVMKK